LGNSIDFKINKNSFIDLLITLKYIGIYIKKKGVGDRERG